jgi:hypothetical protein
VQDQAVWKTFHAQISDILHRFSSIPSAIAGVIPGVRFVTVRT